MATKAKRSTSAPRRPEKKWGPFHGGVGVAVWLNEVQTDAGPKFFRSISIQPRRYCDKKSGEWKDAASLRTTDLPALMLGLEAAMSFIAHTPLPGQSLDDEDEIDFLADRERPTNSATPF
jgi:hypothetical protein